MILQLVVEIYQVDSTYINIYNASLTNFKRIYEYTKPGVQKTINYFKESTFHMSPLATNQMMKKGYFQSDDIKKENSRDQLINILKVFKVKSTLVYPIMINQNLIGSIGITYNRKKGFFGEEHHRMLRLLSDGFSKLFQQEYNHLKLDINQTLYKQILDHFPYPIAIVNTSGQIIDINPQFESLFGVVTYEVLRKDFFDILTGIGYSKIIEYIQDDSNTKSFNIDVFKFLGGEKKILRLNIFKVTEHGHVFTCIVIKDVTKHKIEERKLRKMAYYDLATGLNNRNYFLNICKKLKKIDYNSIGIILFDIDNLKRINERYGLEVGDQVITATSKIISDLFSNELLSARVGGDEFIVYIINQDEPYIEWKMNEFYKRIELYNQMSNIKVYVSVGKVYKQDSNINIIDLITEADQNLKQVTENKLVPLY